MITKSIMLAPTKKPLAMNGFDVPVRICFDGQGIPIRLSYHKSHTISQYLSTAARYAVEYVRFNCACLSDKNILNDCNQSIVTVIRGLTPRTGRQTYIGTELDMGALVRANQAWKGRY